MNQEKKGKKPPLTEDATTEDWFEDIGLDDESNGEANY